MKLQFFIRFHTQFGQTLSIQGNLPGYNDVPLPLAYFNNEWWWTQLHVDDDSDEIRYRYQLTLEDGTLETEAEADRTLDLKKLNTDSVQVYDTWNSKAAVDNIFYTQPFTAVFNKKIPKEDFKKIKGHTHLLRVKAPQLNNNEVVAVAGSGKELGDWNVEKPLLLQPNGRWWELRLELPPVAEGRTYKYGIWNKDKKEFVRYETGDNRSLPPNISDGVAVLHDGFVRLPVGGWKGAGVAIPVFSLRTNNSFGVGEFADIKCLVDWAAQTGLKLIQLLPINDTTATHTWKDSYPYAAISAFALHPLYINLQEVAGKKLATALKPTAKTRRQLNSLQAVDYEKVMSFKMRLLRELFSLQDDDFTKNDGYQQFFQQNKHWLKPYAAFCTLRDRYGTADYTQWKTHNRYSEVEIDRISQSKFATSRDIKFWYWVQYHLHLQLKDAVAYAHKKGIAIKGDIAIGVYRYGADTWTEPELYNRNWQAGAPPDDFAVKGQNWGFPTYNWDRMAGDGFAWWRQRFAQMSEYFDAFRIDHILGFFRIWSIPLNAVEGILGRFVPAIPVYEQEFAQNAIHFDEARYCEPFITDAVLLQIFGDKAETAKADFLKSWEGRYKLQPDFATQRQVQQYFDSAGDEIDQSLKIGLFDLISNVILFKGAPGEYHFRISMDRTSSYQLLDDNTKRGLYELYINYFYRRQDTFWKKEALKKLPALKEATDMLVCGEDLGMVPHCVPEVMQSLSMLSLEIQRMPKNPETEFFHPKTAPYLSVITPSTHDMSTIRGWWEEDRSKTQRFYNTVLESGGEAPSFCEPWVARAIVLQHLYAPAMWSIFQIQDLLAMSDTLRREAPQEERINNPANPEHYWQYRMHITLEDLIRQKDFNNELQEYIANSGR